MSLRLKLRGQARQYSVTKEENKVAKFPGQKGSDGKYTVSLIEGDGIGPEVCRTIPPIRPSTHPPPSPHHPHHHPPRSTLDRHDNDD